MANFQFSGDSTSITGTIVAGNQVIINGVKLPPCPGNGNNVSTIDNKVYIDGYEFKNGKWVKTIRAWWHKYF